jgi:hypothetical protein
MVGVDMVCQPHPGFAPYPNLPFRSVELILNGRRGVLFLSLALFLSVYIWYARLDHTVFENVAYWIFGPAWI